MVSEVVGMNETSDTQLNSKPRFPSQTPEPTTKKPAIAKGTGVMVEALKLINRLFLVHGSWCKTYASWLLAKGPGQPSMARDINHEP